MNAYANSRQKQNLVIMFWTLSYKKYAHYSKMLKNRDERISELGNTA